MITKRQAAALQRRIADHVQAALDNSWKGGAAPPEDWDDIEAEAKRVERDLQRYIDKLTVKGAQNGKL